MNDRVYSYLEKLGLTDRIMKVPDSTETVELASLSLNCSESEVAKTLSFYVPEPILVVTSGDVKIDNDKFRKVFGCKPVMIPKEEVMDVIGHPIGGVCPFNPNPGVKVYLDKSLHKNKFVYPACGVSRTAIKLTIKELMMYTSFTKWIDVCDNN